MADPVDDPFTPTPDEPLALYPHSAIYHDSAEDENTGPTDSEKLDFLFQTAVKVQNLIDQVTPDDIGKIQKTVSNPLVRKMLGL